jgi:hypothetical protein
LLFNPILSLLLVIFITHSSFFFHQATSRYPGVYAWGIYPKNKKSEAQRERIVHLLFFFFSFLFAIHPNLFFSFFSSLSVLIMVQFLMIKTDETCNWTTFNLKCIIWTFPIPFLFFLSMINYQI